MDARRGLEDVAQLLGVEEQHLEGGLNLVEAGRLLGIAPSTLRQRALQGRISYQRDGRAWRFFWWHIRDYLQEREHEAVSPVKVNVGRPGQDVSQTDVEETDELDWQKEAFGLGLLN